MSRKPQSIAVRGSQKWLQILANDHPELFAREIRSPLGLKPDDPIRWLSPLKTDAYAEYSDEAFLTRLAIYPAHTPLASFWPLGGPVWDGLATTDRGDLVLIEAKAHLGELKSTPTRASEPSLGKIQASLAATQHYMNANTGAVWTRTYFQYTNRLAHLYFLRVLNCAPAYLVFVYFINDHEMHGPTSRIVWHEAIKDAHTALGLGQHALQAYIIDVFIDVDQIKARK